MVKKVTAPKTHTPSGNRPREYLAYLNQREMDYLRALNGGYMERGPRGLPSFAEDKLAGPSGGASSGKPSGGSSSSGPGGSGAGGKTTSSPGATPSSTAPAKTGFDKTQAMMTDANGVSYDYSGNVIKSPTTAPKSNSFASPNFPSTVNIDKQIESQGRIKDAISAVKNTPALKNDGVTGFKAQSLGAKPAQTVSVKPTVSQTSVPQKMMSEVDTPYLKAEVERQTQANKAKAESSGLFGRVTNTPRDFLSAPSRTAPSTTKVTPKERQEIKQAVIGGIGGILKDPVGSAVSGASKAVTSVGDFAKKTFDTIGLADNPEYRSIPGVKEAAAEAAAEAALNYGLLGGVASIAAPIPKNSLGSLVVGRSTADKAIRSQFDAYDRAIQRGASPEDAFYESLRNGPSYSGGVVDIVADVPKSPNEAVRFAQGVEIEEPFNLRSSGLVDDAIGSVFGKKPLSGVSRYDQVFERGPINESYPEVGNMPVYKDPDYPTFNALKGGTIGFYSPAGGMQPGLWNSATPGERFNALKYGSTAIQAPMKQNIVARSLGAGDVFRRNAAHEGQHRVADVDLRRGVSTPIPQGTNDLAQEAMIRDAISQSSLPPMSTQEIQDLAWSRYKYGPGEIIARQAEDFLDRPVRSMRDYRTRFGNMSLDDLRNIMRYGISEP